MERLPDGVAVYDTEKVNDCVLEIVGVGGIDLVCEAEVVRDQLEVRLVLVDSVSGTDEDRDAVALGVVVALTVGGGVIVSVALMVTSEDREGVAVGSSVKVIDAVMEPENVELGVEVCVPSGSVTLCIRPEEAVASNATPFAVRMMAETQRFAEKNGRTSPVDIV